MLFAYCAVYFASRRQVRLEQACGVVVLTYLTVVNQCNATVIGGVREDERLVVFAWVVDADRTECWSSERRRLLRCRSLLAGEKLSASLR